jgi:molybdenum cofactor synthesis domain-containing protein
VVHAIVVGDNVDEISGLLIAWADGGDVNLILTTGGTGIAARDVTPEATKSVLDRELPGFGELMRAEGRKKTKFSVLSRAVAGTRGATLIINLPGSPRGALDSLEALISVIPHAIDLLAGRTEHS